MVGFIVFAALLVAASLVFVLLPLWRAGAPTPDKRREANIAVYHQRYDEIEREVGAGRLTRVEAEREKDALGARLLADVDETPAPAETATPATRPWLATLGMTLLLVGGSSATYWYTGNFDAVTAAPQPDIAAMIGDLEQRVAANPDDLQARAMLARAQQVTGDYAGAAASFRAINAAMPQPRVPILAAEAAATLQASDDLQGRAADLYRQVLELDANSSEALWYLGLAAAERNDSAQAIGYWDRLLAQDLPDEFANMVRNRRAELAGEKPALSDE